VTLIVLSNGVRVVEVPHGDEDPQTTAADLGVVISVADEVEADGGALRYPVTGDLPSRPPRVDPFDDFCLYTCGQTTAQVVTGEVRMRVRCTPWKDEKRGIHDILVDVDEQAPRVRVWDPIGRIYTVCHRLTPRVERGIIARARKLAAPRRSST
jgi:hypothetical protein